MGDIRRVPPVVPGLLGVAAFFFLLGITWGLPSARVKPYLYGSEVPWSGENIYFLAGGFEGTSALGADVDRTPLAQRTEPILLNASNRQRAQIIRRYLLYSYQPDEMITFRALAAMGNSWDPRLYQYGGLWIYPVGAMIRTGMLLHLIPRPPADTNALVFYLDNPDAFARFYVAGRFYTVIWGVIGAWAVWWIARRLIRDDLIAGAAALAYIFLPVVMNGAHEAKPHLPGVVLMLLAIAAAIKYLEEPQRKREWLWALAAGALCGAAFGMVISSLAIFIILPFMVWRRRREPLTQRLLVLAASIAVGVAIYVITNPYVPINAASANSPGGQALRSNLRNSTDMYRVSAHGFINAINLIGLGASPLLALLGVAGAIALIALARKSKPAEPEPEPISATQPTPSKAAPLPLPKRSLAISPPVVTSADIAWLFIPPALIIAIQFLLLAADKPPEYARFAMLPDIALLLFAAWAGSRVAANNLMFRQLLAALLVVVALPYGLAYSRAFIRDTRASTSRLQAADEIPVTGRVLLTAEPGPYNTPPMNLFSRDLVLLPKGSTQILAPGDLLIYPVDAPLPDDPTGKAPKRLPFSQAPGSLDQFTTPITWANKTFALEGAAR